MDKIRTFVALELPVKVKEEIAKLQKKLSDQISPGIRWLPPGNIHLTLAFLGNHESEEVKKICAVVAELASHAAQIVVRPRQVKNFHHVLALRLQSKRLDTLYRNLRNALHKAGIIYRDQRLFRPHITIGRFNGQLFKRLRQKVEFPAFTFKRIAVLKSTLQKRGAKHQNLASFSFRSSNPG